MHPSLATTMEFLLVDRLAPWLLTYALHSSLAMIVGLVLARTITQSQPRERLWKLILVGPLFTASLPLGGGTGANHEPLLLPDLAPNASTVALVSGASPGTLLVESSAMPAPLFPLAQATPSVTDPLEAQSSRSSTPWSLLVVSAWITLAICATFQLLFQRRRQIRKLGPRRRLHEGELYRALQRLLAGHPLSSRVRLTQTEELSSPVAIGRSEICVPSDLQDELKPAEWDNLLAHELAHLARRDPAWLLGTHLLERLLFFQPMLRLVRRRMAVEMELLADAWAVRQTKDPVHMARCLETIAHWVDGRDRPGLEPGMASSPSQLVRRIKSVLEPQDPVRSRRSSRLVGLVGVLGLVAMAHGGPRVRGAALSPTAIEEMRREWLEDLAKVEARPAQEPASSPASAQPQQTGSRIPLILPGDSLKFSDPKQPVLNFSATVSKKGGVSIPRLGDFLLWGQASDDVAAILRKRLLSHFDSCDLELVHTPEPNRYFVYGAVNKPGARHRLGAMTLLEAVLIEQAEAAEQDLSRVTLFRPAGPAPQLLTIDVGRMLQTGDTSSNILLEDDDNLLLRWGPKRPGVRYPDRTNLKQPRAYQEQFTYAPGLTDRLPGLDVTRKVRIESEALGIEAGLYSFHAQSLEGEFKDMVRQENTTAPWLAAPSLNPARPVSQRMPDPPAGWTIRLQSGHVQAQHVDETGAVLTFAGGPTFPGASGALRAWLKRVVAYRLQQDTLEAERLNPGIRPAHPRYRAIDKTWLLLVPADTSIAVLTDLMNPCLEAGIQFRSMEAEHPLSQQNRTAAPSGALEPGDHGQESLTIGVMAGTKAESGVARDVGQGLMYQLEWNRYEEAPTTIGSGSLSEIQPLLKGLDASGKLRLVWIRPSAGVEPRDLQPLLNTVIETGARNIVLVPAGKQ